MMDNLISRQAAIDFIDAGHLVNPNEPRWSDNEVVNFLKSRPSAQPERKTEWIPCSERLPENDERVLATTAWGEVTIAERVYPSINDTCWFIYDGNTNATINDVIAWISLPSPYQAERREDVDNS